MLLCFWALASIPPCPEQHCGGCPSSQECSLGGCVNPEPFLHLHLEGALGGRTEQLELLCSGCSPRRDRGVGLPRRNPRAQGPCFLRPSQETPFLGKLAGAGFGGTAAPTRPPASRGSRRASPRLVFAFRRLAQGPGQRTAECLSLPGGGPQGPGRTRVPPHSGLMQVTRAEGPCRTGGGHPTLWAPTFIPSLPGNSVFSLLREPPPHSATWLGRGCPTHGSEVAQAESAHWTIPPSRTGIQIGCLLGWGSH